MAPSSSTSSSSWLRRALAVLGFVALVVLGDQLLGRGLAGLVESSQFRFSRLYRGDVDADILVVGNSRAVAALPPPMVAEATGRRVFSIAYNGLSAEVSRALVADFLERNRTPELIVIEASFVAQPLELITDLKLWAGESPRLAALLDKYNPEVAFASRLSLLFRANSEFLLRALYFGDRTDQTWMNRGRISEDKYRALLEAEAEPIETTPELLVELRQLIALCREAGIEVRLFVAPYLPATRARLGVDRWVAGLSAALSPAPIADFSAALDQRDHFADRIHPNELGARRLIEVMAARGVLPTLTRK